MSEDIEALWRKLEERDEFVQPSRSHADADGQRAWVVTLHGRRHSGVTLAEACRAALDAPPAPRRVPRPPSLWADAELICTGRNWNVLVDSIWLYGPFRTKRDAVATITARAVAYAEWYEKWAPSMEGAYGVDWLWQDDPR